MFGLFKSKVSPEDFGEGILALSKDWLSSDAGKSLETMFPDFGGSVRGPAFLEAKGITAEKLRLYTRFYTHCTIQAACTQFDTPTRSAMTNGAMSTYVNQLPGYDFKKVFDLLEASYGGQRVFEQTIENLSNSDARITLLPARFQYAGVSNAKFLLSKFVISNVKDSDHFIDEFGSYSIHVSSTIGTVNRAIMEVSKKFKL